jgi:hypothetical protein
MLVEAYLAEPRESLQVPVPDSYRGARRDNEDPTIHITTQPAYFTPGEIELVEAHVAKLKYTQSVILTGAKIVGAAPLLEASAKQLDEIEKSIGSGSTKLLDDGSDRPLLDRALILLENGFEGVIPNVTEVAVEASSSKSGKTPARAAELAA